MTKKNTFIAFSINYSRQVPLVKSTDDKKHFSRFQHYIFTSNSAGKNALIRKKNKFHAFSITYSRQVPLVKSTDDKKKTLFTLLALHIHVKFHW